MLQFQVFSGLDLRAKICLCEGAMIKAGGLCNWDTRVSLWMWRQEAILLLAGRLVLPRWEMGVLHIVPCGPVGVGRGKCVTWRRACTEHPDILKEFGDNHASHLLVKKPQMDGGDKGWRSGGIQGPHIGAGRCLMGRLSPGVAHGSLMLPSVLANDLQVV